MKRSTFALALLALASCSAPSPQPNATGGTDYYVRTDGDDQNAGLADAPGEAWATIEHALDQVGPGDRILVGDGTYVTDGLLIDSLQGTAERPIVLKAISRHGAVLTRPETADSSVSVVQLEHAAYVTVEGFEIYDEYGMESGVDVRDGSHHVTIRGNYIHDNACGGISSRLSDYLVFEENIVRDNAKRNKWNCSGLSIWHPVEHDQAPGFHIVIRNNVAFENECDIPFAPHGFDNPTDGNGIIVDDFRNTQGGGQEGGYKAAVLIENNLSFSNGGRGINVYQTDNVTVRNNTIYHNLRILSNYVDFPGDITLSNSEGSRVYNNLVVKNPAYATKALRLYDNDGENTKVHHNLVVGPIDYNGQALYAEANVVRAADGQEAAGLINPLKDITALDADYFRQHFGLREGSPALDIGTGDEAPAADIDGVARPQGAGIDVGAYERVVDD